MRERLVELMAEAMLAELRHPTNLSKGNSWEQYPPEQHEFDLLYHSLKLVLAYRGSDPRSIREHAADVANTAAMLADGVGALNVSVEPRPENDDVGTVGLKVHTRLLLQQLEDAIAADPWVEPVTEYDS